MKHNWKVSLIFAALLTLFVAYPAYSVKYDKSNPTKMYSKAYKMIDKGQYSKAQKILKNYTKSEPEDPDGWTLLAFTYRKLDKFAESEEYYLKALNLEPDNKAALEYQGELFIETNRIDLANANIKKLQNLCPNSCEELEKLQSYLLDQSSKSNI
ncbi:MAG: tetratricopeptide repeat protein [Pseudomonadota bacterium]|nr:tetratricopeptide repeat protein [Pseudomonadota bacterium]MEC8108543.1 tetratricopeptide repeat protein [Pseudomonadota bacterium]MEC9193629.1 tetratricopeptide repeat protein [Pseudomonadota bacterium]